MSVFVCSVRLANEGCQNKVRGARLQLFTEEDRQKTGERERKKSVREKGGEI